MSLRVADFTAYFHALWDQPDRPCDPYPWQERLVQSVYERGDWPEQLDLPTGAGKTSALDIAVFLLALEANKPAASQRFPRRVFMVVDRRTIVDQGFQRALQIGERLAGARDGVLAEVADRLRGLTGGDPESRPVEATVLRGAMLRDDGWARRPDQPVLALSTVDQVGSRLLFRGYGVSDGMKPVHAGLLGSDCLYLLDEVHLSVAFEQTLSAVRDRYMPDGAKIQVCRLSATHRGGQPADFALDARDREHPVLKRRLMAPKPATLLPVDVKGEEAVKVGIFAAKLAEQARLLARPGATVGVIVNRVETARRVAEALDGAEVALITGRMRPLDREETERRIKPWVDPDRRPWGSPLHGDAPPRFVVATQCVEAGADYDLDALVTECAPLDALRQRLGRLNRSGLREGASAVIALRKDQVKGSDPVYGEAMAKTWTWLSELKSLDFNIYEFETIAKTAPADLISSGPTAPLLLPAHLDALVQTSPIPAPDPDISLFLHGPQRVSVEVSVVWRADLPTGLYDAPGPGDVEAAIDQLEAAPPGGLEALSLPMSALRRWLSERDRGAISLSDAGATAADDDDDEGGRASAGDDLRALVWRGESSDMVPLERLRPGDTVVLPSSVGGLALGSFDPTARQPVNDLGDLVQRRLRGRPTLRLHPAVLAPWGDWAARAPMAGGEHDDLDARIDDWLAEAPEGLWSSLGGRPEALLSRKKRRMVLTPAPRGAWITLVSARREKAGEDASTEAETSSHTGVRVPLRAHLEGVGAWAERFGAHVGLPAERIADLASAGRWHDLGKADPRFQLWLHNGNPVAAAMSEAPLAKSATPAQDRAARARALVKSGYPSGARHELMSLALLEAAPEVRAEVESRGGDWDLVCFLVASHHGYGRPFAPVVPDELPVDVSWEGITRRSDHGLERLDSGVSDRFWRLVRRYTPHGLARLEALLRLADHHESALEQAPGRQERP